MKLKYPKQITVGSTTFKIKWDKTKDDGDFSYGKDAYVRIGTKPGTDRILEIIIHELKEIINVEQAVRFTSLSNEDEYKFVYSHNEHTDMCSRLAGLLREFIQ